MRRDAAELRRLAELIQDRLGDELGSFIEARLGRAIEALSLATSGVQVRLDLVTAAERGGWMVELLVALGRSLPDDPELLGFWDSYGMGPIAEKISSRKALSVKGVRALMTEHRGKLGTLETRMCTIEESNKVLGSGFLVGPRLVLTASAVLRDATSPVFRFDQVVQDGAPIVPGEVHTAAREVFAPKGSTYAVVTLRENLGTRPIDPARSDQLAPQRGYISKPQEGPLEGGVLLWAWRDHHGTYLTGVKTELESTGPSDQSIDVAWSPHYLGAPCLDGRLEVIGLVCGPIDARHARMVTLSGIDLPGVPPR